MAFHRQRYHMTIRAEDGRGYVATSRDGLQWSEQRPWCWDDGQPLDMSTTQQHWLTHSDGLFLAYTRKDPSNVRVMRWRAPVYVAQVDPAKPALLRSTEQIVFPLIGDGVNDPDGVARMGNFHVMTVTSKLSLALVGETLPAREWRGDTLLARIWWKRPNREVPVRP